MAGVQFNLLPESRMKSVDVDRRRKLITSIATLVTIISVGLFVLSFFAVNVVQSKQLKDSEAEINQLTSQLKGVKNLDKVLTIQNQLTSLVQLNQSKHITSRVFGYLAQVTPTNVHIGGVTIDFVSNSITITGTAKNQHAVNTFIDTLKFTKYTIPGQSGETSAFPSVVETSFSIIQGDANYSLTIHFDPALFKNGYKNDQSQPVAPKLIVPSITTTRSVINDPANALFNGQNTGGSDTQP